MRERMGFQDAEAVASPLGSLNAIEYDPRSSIGVWCRVNDAASRSEAKMECEAETNAQGGRITDQAVVSGACLPT
jgi:hypothetical protein